MQISSDSSTKSQVSPVQQRDFMVALQNGPGEGVKQFRHQKQLKRSRGMLHILFMAVALMAVPYTISSTIDTAIVGGGPATMLWGWILIAFLSFPIALSLAEICSKYPSSSGAYYWCFRLASQKRRVMLSWFNGWMGLVGIWSSSLSVTFGVARLIVAVSATLAPGWTATAWQTYLILLAVTAIGSIPSLCLNHMLPTIDVILCACWTLLGIVVTIICLPIKAAVGRRPTSFVFGHFDPSYSGWVPGWTFFIGLLTPVYGFTGIGIIASMADEVHKPAAQIPKAFVLVVPLACMSGVAFLLPILFTFPDVDTLMTEPSGQPVAFMFELIMGSKAAGFGLWFISFFGTGMFCTVSILCAASRATWAFARDNAIPFSPFFSRVTSKAVPMNAFLLSVTIQLLMGLLLLGSSAAFNAIIGVSVMCLTLAFNMPIAISLLNGREEVLGAPWSLGRVGGPLNAMAVAFACFTIVLISMPAVLPVTDTSMNYASVVFVGFSVIGALWYFSVARFHYVGPVIACSPSFEKPRSTELA